MARMTALTIDNFAEQTKDVLELPLRDEVDFLKALAHPARIKIVHGLTSGKCNVSNMVDCLNIRQSNVSQHLNILRKAGIIDYIRDGKEIKYWVCSEKAKQILDILI